MILYKHRMQNLAHKASMSKLYTDIWEQFEVPSLKKLLDSKNRIVWEVFESSRNWFS